MARIRTVKPEFWTDSKTGNLTGDATKLFIGMLNFADDYGVLEYDLAALKVKIFPYDNRTPCESIGKLLVDELLPRGLVILFKWDESDKSYLFIKNFHKHQKVDKPSAPLIKGFSDNDIQDFINRATNGGTLLVLDEYSASPRPGREGKGEEGKGEEGKLKSTTPPKNRFLEFVLLTEGQHQGLVETYGEGMVKEYIERLNNYIGAKGVRYKSHYHVLQTWIRKDRPQTEKKRIGNPL